jgi:FAD/FMN-containing dehydrogenase
MCCGGDDTIGETFPKGAQTKKLIFESFDRTMLVSNIWHVFPKDKHNLLEIVNWAANNGWIIRPLGGKYTWAPYLVPELKTKNQKLLLVDMKGAFSVVGDPDAETRTIRVGAGATFNAVLDRLDLKDLTLTAYPADGTLTIGGTITAGTHGSVCSDVGDAPNPHGSIANFVTSFEAIVWDAASKQYVAREFDRSTDEGRAYLVSLGRVPLLEVTLRAMPQYFARCITDVSKDLLQVFRLPGEPGGQGATFVERAMRSGRYAALTLPLIDTVWHREVSLCPTKPESSKEVDGPYSFPYMANVGIMQEALLQFFVGVPHKSIGEEIAQYYGPRSRVGLLQKTLQGIAGFAQRFEDAFGITGLKNQLTKGENHVQAWGIELLNFMQNLGDAWGKSHHLLINVANPPAMRVFGYVITTSEGNLQTAASVSMRIIRNLMHKYANERKQFPVALPIEYRISKLDDDVASGPPMLSFIRSDETTRARGWGYAIAVEVVYFARAYGSNSFVAELEKQLVEAPELSGDSARISYNWGKGFAYSALGPWHSQELLAKVRAANPEWDKAMGLLDAADPTGVFQTPFTRFIHRTTTAPAGPVADQPLPWDVPYGGDSPGCCGRCGLFWCCGEPCCNCCTCCM